MPTGTRRLGVNSLLPQDCGSRLVLLSGTRLAHVHHVEGTSHLQKSWDPVPTQLCYQLHDLGRAPSPEPRCLSKAVSSNARVVKRPVPVCSTGC